MTTDTLAQVQTASRWLPSPSRLLRVITGLVLYGIGEAWLVASALGNSPWTVLADGLAGQSGLSIGIITNLIGATLLLLWLPLRQRPGLGTVLNVLLVGTAMDFSLRLLPRPEALGWQLAGVLVGIACVALGSGLYLGVALGPGPRDGLMTGLHRVTGRSIALCRLAVEGSVLLLGMLLGGTAGVGTVIFALGIGSAVQLALRLLSHVPTTNL